ncbi:GntR family transcriptional regulator [Paenibacillus pini]|uniref:Transcriptional regulators n=1 Tax=Paenibacillus pini JCM 16418 TaxID=1236976 RepID=W7YT98_9BACL|nr:hypothetical protein [Paenibacillus pini]GAF10423.1 transcriptional regulators [Paenibacillus pini JCM 16418]
MRTNFDDGLPIFQQIAEMFEDDILTGVYNEEEEVISTTQFAITFQINPATAVKGIALLVNEGVLYKKIGLGMYVVAKGAKLIVMKKRRERLMTIFTS